MQVLGINGGKLFMHWYMKEIKYLNLTQRWSYYGYLDLCLCQYFESKGTLNVAYNTTASSK